MNQEFLEDIRGYVVSLGEKTGCVPPGFRLKIDVSLEPIPSRIEVCTRVSKSLLVMKSVEQWVKDKGKYPPFSGPKISDLLSRPKFSTMYLLVTKSEREIKKQRALGDKSFEVLKKWIETFGLSFGMAFPEHIKKRFEPVEVSRVSTPQDVRKSA